MREEKQLLLDETKENLEAASAFMLTKYSKMDPNMTYEFRKKLTEKGGFFSVVKKNIFLKAAQAAGIEIDRSTLDGHIAIVYTGEDTVEATKVVYNFKKENKKIIEILGGRYEGKFCTPEEVEAISQLPSKDQMRAEFLGTLEAPMAQTVAVLEAILTSTIFCLENKVQSEQPE